jgi:hypothetical protein
MAEQVNRATLVLVAWLVATLLGGCVSQQTADQADQRAVLGGLTRAEFNTALQVARRAAAREDVEVRTAGASLVTRQRRAQLGVHGDACPAGRLIHVRLVGSFPQAASGDVPDATIGGEDLVADPATGRVCARSYLAGRIVTDLSMVPLFAR